MKTILLKLVLIFAFFQFAQTQPVPMNDKDTVWMRWTHNVKYIRFSPDGSLIATNNMGQVVVHETATGDEVYTYSSVLQTRFTPDGKYLVGYLGSELVVIDVATWTKRTDITKTPFGITCYDISKDGKKVIAGYEGKYGYGIWDIESGQIIQDMTLPIEDSANSVGAYIGDIKYGKDDATILYETNRGLKGTPPPPDRQYTIVIDAVTGAQKHRVEFAAFIVYSNDKTKIAYRVLKDNVAIHIIDAETWQGIINIPGLPEDVNDMTFSPDEKYLVVAYGDLGKNISIYDLSNGAITYTYKREPIEGPYTAVSASNNSLYIAAGTSSGRLYLYRAIYNPSIVNESYHLDSIIAYPNPNNQNIINLEFNLESANYIKINLFDNLGKFLKNVEQSFLNSGHYLYPIDISNISNGEYHIRFEYGKSRLELPIIISR